MNLKTLTKVTEPLVRHLASLPDIESGGLPNDRLGFATVAAFAPNFGMILYLFLVAIACANQ